MSMREDEILEKLRQDVQIPERVQQKAEEAFASIKKDARKRHEEESMAMRKVTGKVPRKKIWVLAAAALLVFGTVTAGAAAYMQIGRAHV